MAKEEDEKKDAARADHAAKKGKGSLKVVYMGSDHHNQWEVTDDKPESRKNPVDGTDGQAVAPSSYDRTAINKVIGPEDLEDYPELKGKVAVGDFVDEREFNEFVGKENKEHPMIDPEFDKTDEELNQDK